MKMDPDYTSIANQTLLDICNGLVKSFDDVAICFKLIEDEHKYSEADGANIPEMISCASHTSTNDCNPGDKCSFQAIRQICFGLPVYGCLPILQPSCICFNGRKLSPLPPCLRMSNPLNHQHKRKLLNL
jgi:hypothetical protein